MKKALVIGASVVAVLVIVVIAGAVVSGGQTPASTTTSASAPASPYVPAPPAPVAPTPPAVSKVEFRVTGSAPAGYIDPTVTYGPEGTSLDGSIPMDKAMTIPDSAPDFYSIDAQLSDAGGSITCEILVNGDVLSKASATGADNIASCEIDQDPFTGQWEDTNS